jgi:amino acid transporter
VRSAIIIILLIDAVISPSGTGWIYAGTTTRSLYGLAANGYLPERFMKLGKTKIPTLSLIVGMFLGAPFLLPFPTWQTIVTYNASATIFTYLMGGIGLEALRRKAADLPAPIS